MSPTVKERKHTLSECRLLICSVAAFGPFSAEHANHASFPCLVSQEFPQISLYEIRCYKHVFLLSWLNMRKIVLVLFCKGSCVLGWIAAGQLCIFRGSNLNHPYFAALLVNRVVGASAAPAVSHLKPLPHFTDFLWELRRQPPLPSVRKTPCWPLLAPFILERQKLKKFAQFLKTCFFQGVPKGRQQKGETGPGTHIFADFCRFSQIFGSLCKSRDLGVADLRRKPQETADFRRKPQKTADFCRNRFSPICCLRFGALLFLWTQSGKIWSVLHFLGLWVAEFCGNSAEVGATRRFLSRKIHFLASKNSKKAEFGRQLYVNILGFQTSAADDSQRSKSISHWSGLHFSALSVHPRFCRPSPP